MHGYGTKTTLHDVFAKIEDDMEMLKGVTSKNDIIAADGCEYSSVKFIECDGYLLIGFESPANVTPEIESVIEGTMFDGREGRLTQDVFAPESNRVRNGFVDFVLGF